MRNTISRVEKLEQAFGLGVAQVPPQVIHVQYVERDGEVTGGFDVVVGQPHGQRQSVKATPDVESRSKMSRRA